MNRLSNIQVHKVDLQCPRHRRMLDGTLVSIPLGDLTPNEPLPMHALNFYPGHAIVLDRDYEPDRVAARRFGI